MRAVRYRLEAAVFSALLALASRIPRSWLRAWGRIGGSLLRLLDRRHDGIALDNLRGALGDEKDDQELRRIARRCWSHFGEVTLDTLAIARMEGDEVRSLVRYEGLEHIRSAYDRGKGVLLFSGHFGHWELVALMQGYLGLPLALVTRPLDNPRLERLLARVRGRSGNRIIHKRNAVRAILGALREGIGVAIVIDQDARNEGIFVPFLGRPASTTPTLALVALRTGAAIVPTYSIPEPDGRYRIVYEPPVVYEPSGNRQLDVQQLTEHCTRILEGWVRRHPELWLWMHRRWKTRPPDEMRD